jgi:hypothetical protein
MLVIRRIGKHNLRVACGDQGLYSPHGGCWGAASLAAFMARGDAFELALANSRIGVLESLRSCADDAARRCDWR